MFASSTPQTMSPREALNIVGAGCAQAPANKETHILMEQALRVIEAALYPPPPPLDKSNVEKTEEDKNPSACK